MTWVDLLFLPPLMLAVAVIVGGAGRLRGDVPASIRRTFIGLTAGVVLVGVIVRALVVFFA